MYKNPAIALLMVILFAWLLPPAALSHGGGTDANGCHTNSKTGKRHCHSPKASVSSSRSAETLASPSAIVYLPEECKDEFGMQRLLSHADTGYVHAHCGDSSLFIKSH